MTKQDVSAINEDELLAKMGLRPSSAAAPPPPPAVAAASTKVEAQEVSEAAVHEVDRQQPPAGKTKAEGNAKKVTPAAPPPVTHKKGSYEDLFLKKGVKGAHAELTQFRIPTATHKKLSAIVLAAHGSNISLVDYVNNVLLHHLQKHKDDLQRCRDERQKDIEF